MSLLIRVSRIRNTPLRASLCLPLMIWRLPAYSWMYISRGRCPPFEFFFTVYMAVALGGFLDVEEKNRAD